MFVTTGGIAGSLIFRTQDAPGYLPGLYGCMAAAALSILSVLVLDLKFWFDNKKQAEGRLIIEGGEVGQPHTKENERLVRAC